MKLLKKTVEETVREMVPLITEAIEIKVDKEAAMLDWPKSLKKYHWPDHEAIAKRLDELDGRMNAFDFHWSPQDANTERMICIQRQLNDLEDSIGVKISEAIGEAMDGMGADFHKGFKAAEVEYAKGCHICHLLPADKRESYDQGRSDGYWKRDKEEAESRQKPEQESIKWVPMTECEATYFLPYLARLTISKDTFYIVQKVNGYWYYNGSCPKSAIKNQEMYEVTPLEPLLKNRVESYKDGYRQHKKEIDGHEDVPCKENCKIVDGYERYIEVTYKDGKKKGREEALKELEDEWVDMEGHRGLQGVIYFARNKYGNKALVLFWDGKWKELNNSEEIIDQEKWKVKPESKIH